VTVGSRVLVLGTTEQQVQLLTELDPEELEVMDPALESDLDQPVQGVPVAAPVAAPAAAPAAARTFEPAAFAPAAFAPASFDPGAAPTYASVAASATVAQDVVVERRPKVRRKQAAPLRTAPSRADTVSDGPLAGSLLSTQTWKQALAAATGRGMDLS
jgi:flagellar protein FliO/FliZ